MNFQSTCPICFEDLDKKNRAKTDVCDHLFCFPCLQTWSKHGNFCPIDRRRFQKIINVHYQTVLKVKPHKRKFGRAIYDVTVYCEECRNVSNSNTLLLCDSCNLGYHCDCLCPPLTVIPNGRWYCPDCVAVELRLRTNTPAGTKCAKTKRRKLKKKSYKNISKGSYLFAKNTTNEQNSDHPGPSKASTSTSDSTSLSLDFDLDPEDFVFSYSDEEDDDSDEIEDAITFMNCVHQQEQHSTATTSVSNSISLEYFDEDPFLSSDDGKDASSDTNNAQEQDEESFDFEDADMNSSSEDCAAENANRDVDKDDHKEKLSVAKPPTDDESFSNFSEDSSFRNFNFEFSPSAESEKEDQDETSCNQQEQLPTIYKSQEKMSSDSTPQGISTENVQEAGMLKEIENTNTSKENIGLIQEEQRREDLNSLSSEDKNSNQCTDKLREDLCQKEQDNIEKKSSSCLDCALSDFPESSGSTDQVPMEDVQEAGWLRNIEAANTSKENVDINQKKQRKEDFSLSSEVRTSIQCTDKLGYDLCQKEQINTEKTSSSSLNCGFSDFPESSGSTDQVSTENVQEAGSLKNIEDVNTSKENVDLNQEKQSKEDFNSLSSEDSNSMQCADKLGEDLCLKERNTDETSSSSSSSDCGFSDYPDATVLKLPLRLTLKRNTTTSTDKGSSTHSSTDATVKNINDVSANFCKIAAVTSCAFSLFQNSESESIAVGNKNVDPNIDVNENHTSLDTSSARKDNQVDNTTSHSSNPFPVAFSLIVNSSSQVSQAQKVHSYESLISSKDKDPSSGETHCAAINKVGGTYSHTVKEIDASSYPRCFANVGNSNPLTVANRTSPSKTLIRNDFRLFAEECGKLIIPPNLTSVFKEHIFIKDIKQLSAQKDGALFLNWQEAQLFK